ncbi:MAG: mannose-1-phosphate guanyltransferase [Rhodobacterales bacterium]|nr:MAG: mannose-1-phosphate guanyltransferase [Rhodobacterales bacterium]
MNLFSFARFLAVLVKEFVQMRRDRMSFAMMIGIPIIQLIIFGYAINADPHNLPTMIEMNDESPVARSLVAAMDASDYFDFLGTTSGAAEGDRALRDGSASFILVIPPDFERDIVRGLAPEILLSVDASDPVAVATAVGALNGVMKIAIAETLDGPLKAVAGAPPPFSLVTHKQFNPEGRTATNIVPGLLAVVLALTMVMITAVAIVREIERGTMETLLATPVRAPEVMFGKILPYVFVGYIQTGVFLIAGRILFDVPFLGAPLAFFIGFNIYIVVNLALGFLISTLVRNQMQAMQASFLLILPTILLSGFAFPFAGMPGWAQAIGSAIPATHFVRIVRKVMLKGAEFADIAADLRAIVIIGTVIVLVAMLRYRQTLD